MSNNGCKNNDDNNINAEEWTVEDVGNWLTKVGYEKYKDIFIGLHYYK